MSNKDKNKEIKREITKGIVISSTSCSFLGLWILLLCFSNNKERNMDHNRHKSNVSDLRHDSYSVLLSKRTNHNVRQSSNPLLFTSYKIW